MKTIRNIQGSTTIGILAIAGIAVTAQADIIIEQEPAGFNAIHSDLNAPSGFQQADNFVLTSETSLGILEFWGIYTGDAPVVDNFTIRIHQDGFGSPDGNAAFLDLSGVNPTRTQIPNPLGTVERYFYSFDLGALTLDAGDYWIEIHGDNRGSSTSWAWELSEQGDGFSAFESNGDPWTHSGGVDKSFVLHTAVPAPGSIALLGLGGLAAGRRRR